MGSITRDSKRPDIVWRPFRLEAYDESDNRVFFAGVSHGAFFQLRLRELSEEAVNTGIVRWAIRKTEEAVRAGAIEGNEGVLELPLQQSELELIAKLASAKFCEYQVSRGRDLFCAAADKQADKTKVFEEAHGRLRRPQDRCVAVASCRTPISFARISCSQGLCAARYWKERPTLRFKPSDADSWAPSATSTKHASEPERTAVQEGILAGSD